MTVFRAGMRVKKIFRPDIHRKPETDFIGRITSKGFIKLQSDLADPELKYRLIRPDGRSPEGCFFIVPDNESRISGLQNEKASLLRKLEKITQEIDSLEREMEVTEEMWSQRLPAPGNIRKEWDLAEAAQKNPSSVGLPRREE